MIDAILRIALESALGGFLWCSIGPYIATLFHESSPPPLDQAIALALPCVDWTEGPYTQKMVARWAAAELATPYSEEVRYRVVRPLLQIAPNNSLRPCVPVELWAWLKRQPSLPSVSR